MVIAEKEAIRTLMREKRKLLGDKGFAKWRWGMADMIRGKLLESGIALHDHPNGETTWERA